MFWPFIEIDSKLCYCPLADFGASSVREGHDLYAKAVVAQPITGHEPLHNATEVNRQIVLMERGVCDFVSKALHAQNAGALALIVANTVSSHSKDDQDTAFVMDAGSQGDEIAHIIRIPAMMMSHQKSTILFDQMRTSYLDRRDFFVTIKFLGAQSAASVLEQLEHKRQEEQQRQQDAIRQQQCAKQQHEAAMELKSRLRRTTARSTTSSVGSLVSQQQQLHKKRPSASARSIASSASVRMAPAAPSMADSYETSSVSSSTSSSPRNQMLNTNSPPHHLMMHHWCPMTTALLIMDVQNYFVRSENDDLNYQCLQTVMLPTIQDILLAARACDGIEILYSVVESLTRDGRERSRAYKHANLHIPKGGFGAKVVPSIAPKDNDIVLPRTGINVFESTNLDYLLRNLGVSHLVLLGISYLQSLELCTQTAMDRGYQVTWIHDAMVFEKPDAVSKMQRLGAQVMNSTAFVDELQSYHLSNNDHESR